MARLKSTIELSQTVVSMGTDSTMLLAARTERTNALTKLSTHLSIVANLSPTRWRLT